MGTGDASFPVLQAAGLHPVRDEHINRANKIQKIAAPIGVTHFGYPEWSAI